MHLLPAIMTACMLLQTVCAAELSDLSRELIEEGLISVDDRGLPATECMVKLSSGFSYAQSCAMTEGFGPRSVGCFAVWGRAGVLQQGCYSGQEISLRDQCSKRQCVAHVNRGPAYVSFCCCHGPLCNNFRTSRF